jgi:hypothetical protein
MYAASVVTARVMPVWCLSTAAQIANATTDTPTSCETFSVSCQATQKKTTTIKKKKIGFCFFNSKQNTYHKQ